MVAFASRMPRIGTRQERFTAFSKQHRLTVERPLLDCELCSFVRPARRPAAMSGTPPTLPPSCSGGGRRVGGRRVVSRAVRAVVRAGAV